MKLFKKLLWLLLAATMVLGVVSCSDDDDDGDDPVGTIVAPEAIDAKARTITISADTDLAFSLKKAREGVAWKVADASGKDTKFVDFATNVTIDATGKLTIKAAALANKDDSGKIKVTCSKSGYESKSYTFTVTKGETTPPPGEKTLVCVVPTGKTAITITGDDAVTVTLSATLDGAATTDVTYEVTDSADTKATISGATLSIPNAHVTGTIKVKAKGKADTATAGLTSAEVTINITAKGEQPQGGAPVLTATGSATTVAIGGSLQLLVDGSALTSETKTGYSFATYTAYTETTKTATVDANKVTVSDIGLLALASDTNLVASTGKIYVTVTKDSKTSAALELTVAAAAATGQKLAIDATTKTTLKIGDVTVANAFSANATALAATTSAANTWIVQGLAESKADLMSNVDGTTKIATVEWKTDAYYIDVVEAGTTTLFLEDGTASAKKVTAIILTTTATAVTAAAVAPQMLVGFAPIVETAGSKVNDPAYVEVKGKATKLTNDNYAELQVIGEDPIVLDGTNDVTLLVGTALKGATVTAYKADGSTAATASEGAYDATKRTLTIKATNTEAKVVLKATKTGYETLSFDVNIRQAKSKVFAAKASDGSKYTLSIANELTAPEGADALPVTIPAGYTKLAATATAPTGTPATDGALGVSLDGKDALNAGDLTVAATSDSTGVDLTPSAEGGVALKIVDAETSPTSQYVLAMITEDKARSGTSYTITFAPVLYLKGDVTISSTDLQLNGTNITATPTITLVSSASLADTATGTAYAVLEEFGNCYAAINSSTISVYVPSTADGEKDGKGACGINIANAAVANTPTIHQITLKFKAGTATDAGKVVLDKASDTHYADITIDGTAVKLGVDTITDVTVTSGDTLAETGASGAWALTAGSIQNSSTTEIAWISFVDGKAPCYRIYPKVVDSTGVDITLSNGTEASNQVMTLTTTATTVSVAKKTTTGGER